MAEKKICRTCKEDKELSMFNKNIATKDGRTNECKSCFNKRVSILRKNRQDWVRSLRKNKKCTMCEESRWYCLDFHHKDKQTKTMSIGLDGKRYSKEKVLKEIEKCIVLCANCHREHHHFERNGSDENINNFTCDESATISSTIAES